MKYFYSFDELSMPPWVQVLFWGLYMVVFVYAVWKTLLFVPKDKRSAEVGKLIILYFAIYAVFYCINPDYFSYREWLNLTIFDLDLWGKEKFYFYTILFCQSLPFDYPYEVFRLIVWGGAVFIAYYTFRMYRELLLPGMAMLFLFVFYSNTFCYARASLAMAVYFFGIALCLLQDRKTLKLLGLGIALSSYFFHHELLIGIAVLPCLIIPLERKKGIFLSVFLLIAAIIVISYVNTNLKIFDALFGDDDLSSKIGKFSEGEQGAFRLSTLVKYLNFFYPLYLIAICFWKKRVPPSIAGMYRIAYTIILISVAFMVVFGLRSVFVFRVMYISMIPLALLIAYCYSNRYFNNWQLVMMMFLSLLSNSTRFINAG